MRKLLALCALVLLLQACSKPDMETTYKRNENKVTVTSGVWGTVSFREGNCMPGSGSRTCKEYPVRRVVRFYAPTLVSQATNAHPILDGFFSSFSTALVKEIETDNDGFYQAELAPGTYTMVVLEDQDLYARLTNNTPSGMMINPFTLGSEKVNRNFVIDYKAAY